MFTESKRDKKIKEIVKNQREANISTTLELFKPFSCFQVFYRDRDIARDRTKTDRQTEIVIDREKPTNLQH